MRGKLESPPYLFLDTPKLRKNVSAGVARLALFVEEKRSHEKPPHSSSVNKSYDAREALAANCRY